MGGLTADVDLLVLRRRDVGVERVVLRRWTDTAPWTNGLVERESAALAALAATPVPAPRVLAADPSGTKAGVRCVLMSELTGSVLLAPREPAAWLRSLAAVQASIHRIRPVLTARSDGWFEPGSDRSWIDDPGLCRTAVDVATALGDDDADDVFVHGDFQPFNVLWRGRRAAPSERSETVSGVVDWPNAGTGPRGVDVGHCLLNLAVLHGPDAAAQYLREYEAAAGVRVGAAPQLRALLGWDRGWQHSIVTQVAGRMTVDLERMRARVVETIRRTVDASSH